MTNADVDSRALTTSGQFSTKKQHDVSFDSGSKFVNRRRRSAIGTKSSSSLLPLTEIASAGGSTWFSSTDFRQLMPRTVPSAVGLHPNQQQQQLQLKTTAPSAGPKLRRSSIAKIDADQGYSRRRSWTAANGYVLGQPTTPTDNGLLTSPSVPTSTSVEWIEALCRRWVVRFRSRRRQSWVPSTPSTTPPATSWSTRKTASLDASAAAQTTASLQKQMLIQYEICRRVQSSPIDRLFALFYCWYFGRVDHINALLATAVDHVVGIFSSVSRREALSSLPCNGVGGTSTLRLALSVALVTALALTVAVGTVTLLRVLVTGLAIVIHSALNFVLLVVCLFLVTIATLTFVSFE
jgi:hypothetical protein